MHAPAIHYYTELQHKKFKKKLVKSNKNIFVSPDAVSAATQVSLERNLSCCDYHSSDAITLIYHSLTFLNNVLSNVVLSRPL